VTTYVVYTGSMHTVPIRTAKAHLSEIVDQAIKTHDQVTITRNGIPAAVIISSEEWESLQETLVWLSQGAEHDVLDGLAAHTAGETLSEDEVRRRFSGPSR
jgi:antitoxin YefM